MGCVDSNANSGMKASSHQRKNEIVRMKQELAARDNQIRNLEIQNQIIRKKKMEAAEKAKQIESQEIILMEGEDQCEDYDEDEQTELRQLLKCTLCLEEYDLHHRMPWMVCRNQHTYCSDCISRMMQKNKTECPECRQKMTAGNRNLHLTELLKNITNDGFNQNIMTKSNHSRPQCITISINKTSNQFLNKYEFLSENCISKTGEHAWYGLLCNEVIPVQGKFYFTFEVIMSLHNNIQIGLIDMNSKIQKGKMSNKRITYHLYDGKLMDSGHVDAPTTKWRPGGKPTAKGVAVCKVQVNMDDQQICYFVNDQLHGKSVITNYMKYVKAVPYLSMHHAGDIVTLNV